LSARDVPLWAMGRAACQKRDKKNKGEGRMRGSTSACQTGDPLGHTDWLAGRNRAERRGKIGKGGRPGERGKRVTPRFFFFFLMDLTLGDRGAFKYLACAS